MSPVFLRHSVEEARHLASMALEPAPIPATLILDGAPVARAKSRPFHEADSGTVHAAIVWDCTSGTFFRQVVKAETVQIIAGSLEITHGKGRKEHLVSGDILTLAAGSQLIIHVNDYVRTYSIRVTPRPSLGQRLVMPYQAFLMRSASAWSSKLPAFFSPFSF